MAEKGESTRARIVDQAMALILAKGYAGTTLDDILRATGLTKGAFFHHFRSKADLARAVVEHYAEADLGLFQRWSDEADRQTDDPWRRVELFLIGLERYLDGLASPSAGCLFASYTYESRQFDDGIRAYIRDRLAWWTALYESKLAALVRARPPRINVSARQLAEMMVTLVEGGFVMAIAMGDRRWLQRQSEQYRNYLRMLFAIHVPAPAMRAEASRPGRRAIAKAPRQ